MLPLSRNLRNKLSRAACFFVLLLLIFIVSGCNKLFHADGAPLKGRTVTLGVTVPETPPPVAKPVQNTDEKNAAVFENTRKAPVDSRLIPNADTSISAPVPYLPQKNAKSLAFGRKSMISNGYDKVLENSTITEDMVLRGTVLVKGYLVVAPQATLKIEPGTFLRFAGSGQSGQHAKLLVQGRLVCSGTRERPITFTSEFLDATPSDWGGIIFLGSEKKNALEHCVISGGTSAIEARNSSIVAKDIVITNSIAGITLHDSISAISFANISRCDTAIHFIDSEVDMKSLQLRENRVGILAIKSSFTLSSSNLRANAQEAVLADSCRFKINGSNLLSNRTGAYIKAGDVQIQQSSFSGNRESGLVLANCKARILNSSFRSNSASGIFVESARGSVSSSLFSQNKNANIVFSNNGSFTAFLNWWDSVDETAIEKTIKEASGKMIHLDFSPFLTSKPPLAP